MNMSHKMFIAVLFIFVLVLCSAIGLVYSKHETRKLFVQLQQLKHKVDTLDGRWSQLQLEQSAWSGHGRIERLARKKLSMKMPKPANVVFVKQ